MANKLNINIELNRNDIAGTIKKLKNLRDGLDKLCDDISKELADTTEQKLKENYQNTSFVDGKATTSVVKITNGYKATIHSDDILYEEFGTGDMGANDGHPWKYIYPLNPYNSGPTIQPTTKLSPETMTKWGLSSGKYWVYRDENNNIIFTQGIPSGKFMYNSAIWLRGNWEKIAKKKVDDFLSQL